MKVLTVLKELPGAPLEFQLLPYGRIDLESEGAIFLDNDAMNRIIGEFERRGNDMVIDYEHQTLKDVQAPAAGWIKKLMNRGKQGLWAVVEWTEKAKSYLTSKEYRYYSPVFIVRKSDRKVEKILNAALTNFPKINHLKPIAAKTDNIVISAMQQKINWLMGISDEDIIRCGLNPSEPDSEEIDKAVMDTAIQEAGKLMGVSKEDIEKYG